MTGPGPGVVRAVDIAAALGEPTPTPEQVRVIEHPLESVLVVAGAGSGKTETMAARVVWLVANRLVAPDNVLGLTFTRKAAGELAARIGRRLDHLARVGLWALDERDPDAVTDRPGELVAPAVSTYHAYAGRLVQEHGLRLGVEPDARLLSPAAAWQLAHEAVTRYDGPMEAVELAESTVTAAVVRLAGELAEHLRSPDELDAHLRALLERVDALPAASRRGGGRAGVPASVRGLTAHARTLRALVPIVRDFTARKRDADALDFADQVAVAARLAEGFPAVGAVERQRYRIVLLDEFQDTSEAQLRLLAGLFAPAAATGPGVPVTAVGDPHQAIYGWRGASATTLTQFGRRFGGGVDMPVLQLTTSWRNDEAILAAANTAAGPLSCPGSAPAVPVARLVPAPGAGRGGVVATRGETAQEEAAAVAEWIAGHWWTSPGGPERSGASAAVLCRRRAQFPALLEALRGRGLPVEVVGLGGLLSTPEVADVIALLGIVADPARGDLLARLLTGPAARLGAADLDAFGAWAHQRAVPSSGEADRRAAPAPGSAVAPLVEALADLPPRDWEGPQGQRLSDVARERLTRLAAAVRQVRAVRGLALPDLVPTLERALGLDVEVLARSDASGAPRGHLDAFAEVAASFAAGTPRPTPGAFLAWLEAARSEERGLDPPALRVGEDAVQLLTVHAAKGLEWDVVAIPGLVEGAFPSYRGAAATLRAGTWRLPPARDRGWLAEVGALPPALRGDAAGLPRFRPDRAGDLGELDGHLQEHAAAGGRHRVAEERRLAYVALTRARHAVHLSGPVWMGGARPRVTSRFLEELRETPGLVEAGRWAPMPPEGVAAPAAGDQETAWWPGTVADGAADVAARLVEEAAGGRGAAALAARAMPGGDVHAGQVPATGEDDLAEAVEVVLAEWAARGREPRARPALPTHLSATDVVRLDADREGFLARLRRPMPGPPAPALRAGTAFHARVERHYRRAALLDVEDLPGYAGAEPDVEDLTRRFLASPWARRTPVDVEVDIETVVGGLAVRGRIDAVFPADTGEGVVLLDWKAGAPPAPAAGGHHDLQLALYRLAYARLTGRALRDVEAAFYYAATGDTVRPRLPDEEELLARVAALTAPPGGTPVTPGPGTGQGAGGPVRRGRA